MYSDQQQNRSDKYTYSSRDNWKSNNPRYNNSNDNTTTTVTGKRDFLQFHNEYSNTKNSEDQNEQFEEIQKRVKMDTRDRDRSDRNDWQQQDYNNNRSRGNNNPVFSAQEEEKLAPWMSQSTQKIKNTMVRFHNEVIDFVNYVAPLKEEHAKREKAMERLTEVISEMVPTAKILPFGSFATCLYLPHGDIDLVIMESNMSAATLINKIARALMKHPDYDSINVIRSAKVPLIKLVEKSTNLNFDLSFNKLDGVNQLKAVQKALDYFPEMKHLLMILKCFLKQRDLNETYTGGIGSFLLFCLILTYLREIRREYIHLGCEDEIYKMLLSEHLLKFFDFYANFDISNKQIIIAEGGAIVDKYVKEPALSVISPQDATHDIGGASFKIKEIFGIFKNRYHFLTNYNFGDRESILKYLIKADLL